MGGGQLPQIWILMPPVGGGGDAVSDLWGAVMDGGYKWGGSQVLGGWGWMPHIWIPTRPPFWGWGKVCNLWGAVMDGGV